MTLQVVILAAGQGKRMLSDMPKVSHQIGGKPLLQHVLHVANKLAHGKKPIVVVGHLAKYLQDQFQHEHCQFALQTEQLGTGHAVLSALPMIADDAQVLILSGDVPLISENTLQRLLSVVAENALGVLTATVNNAKGYGRILRDRHHHISGIIEEKDASSEQLAITEINTGIYLVPAKYLKAWLPMLKNNNAQSEYYLTDVIKMAVAEQVPIYDTKPDFVEEIFGVNDRVQLACLERVYQRMQAEKWMRQGVTILDPARFDVRGDVKIGRDVVIDVGVVLDGNVVIEDHCVIGAHSYLRNTKLASRVNVKSHSVLDGAEVESDSVIGPFARLRPGTMLAREVHIGNFVEVKNSIVHAGSKINHLSYIGDTNVGKQVNIGAGTITCNYDGATKHKTEICDYVHIGSGTQLIAPIVVGEGATIGAGSTLTKDVPPRQLTLTHRLDQRTVKSWERPK